MLKSEATKTVAAMTAIWPRKDLPSASQDAYVKFLLDLDYEAVQGAIERLACTQPWCPSISELREAVLAPAIPSVDEAWGELLKAIGSYGRNRQPVFKNPVLATTVERMQWREICDSENPEALHAHFMRFYGEAAKSETKMNVLTPKGRELMEGMGRSIGRELPA